MCIRDSMKSQIKLPVRMDMDFLGVDVFGDTTKMSFNIDTIGYPPTDLDTSMTVIELNRLGTRIQIYDRTTDSIYVETHFCCISKNIHT